jgi:hypothetical protein
MAEKAATTEPEALEPRAEGEACHGLDMPLPLLQEDSGEPRSPLREAPTKGMHKRGPETLLLPLQDSQLEGEHGPQQAPRET